MLGNGCPRRCIYKSNIAIKLLLYYINSQLLIPSLDIERELFGSVYIMPLYTKSAAFALRGFYYLGSLLITGKYHLPNVSFTDCSLSVTNYRISVVI